MPSPAELDAEHLTEGQAALDEGRWQAARDAFDRANTVRESGEAHEGLGWVGWWVADETLTFSSRERAYELYLDADEPAAAAHVAAWLAADFYEYRDEEIPARGWLKRAHRLIDGHEPVEEHGWIALIDASFSRYLDCDLEAMLPAARRGVEIGRQFDVADLETVGLAYEGMALSGLGFVDEAIAKLDEAASIAVVEDMALPFSPAWAYCCMLSTCEGNGDFPRGLQYCEAMRKFVERWGGRHLFGICRTSYGRILTAGGDWSTAESELVAAIEDFRFARPGRASAGLYRLGELRARQGRSDEARELFEQAGTYGLLGIGEIHLADGDFEEATDIANRVLRKYPDDALIDRLPALELLTSGSIGLEDLTTAERSEAEIERTAGICGTPYVSGRAHLTRAELFLAKGDLEAARISSEDAIDCFAESSAPYDRARAELYLARILRLLDREQRSDDLIESAREMFETLGAERDVEACDRLRSGREQVDTAGPSVSDLTAREIEVLRLVAGGMNNPEIAAELVVSPHTVHRHVANIRTKLRLPSRSAAVAWASRQNLL